MSSVFADDTKSFGKQNLIDDSEESCWQSAQVYPIIILMHNIRNAFKGLGQFVRCKFDSGPRRLSRVEVQFQGGFVATKVNLLARSEANADWIKIDTFYPEDVNQAQSFAINWPLDIPPMEEISLDLVSSSDFFGRFVIYKLALYE